MTYGLVYVIRCTLIYLLEVVNDFDRKTKPKLQATMTN